MKCLIAEFEEQSFTQIIFPHKDTDWRDYLLDAQKNFIEIINAIIKYQKCLVVCDDVDSVKKHFKDDKNLFFVEYKTDDTWARDCSCLCVKNADKVELLDFKFNAWGGKFDAQKDDAMSKNISKHYSIKPKSIDFILEGGGIESNGAGTLLTTSSCMLNKNRNKNLTKKELDAVLKDCFSAKDILYLEHGYLAGDDTDSHIDTLVRFVDEKTLMYVRCNDINDEHYRALKLMEDELKSIASKYDFRLIALPMTDALYDKNERLPATYANFLFVNGAILVPTYGVKQDVEALEIFRKTFRCSDIVGIDCQTLIKQHGSLHCVTMNFACGVGIVI
ncbi:MAG: agmatine deiminase family protein [Epsilonproteobacteria bacterium]|nr:agmatine deiminase family protein [Campylobacterota bacterium]